MEDREEVTTEEDILTDEEIIALLTAFYFGRNGLDDLQEWYYYKVADKLLEGVYDGFGDTPTGIEEKIRKARETGSRNLIEELEKQQEVLLGMRENVFKFSAAKTYEQQKQLRKLLFQNGKIMSFNEFKTEASKIVKVFNETWLRTEYQNAINQAISAKEYSVYLEEKEQFPYIKYKTQEDEKVRSSHRVLNNTTRKVNDSFWDAYYPPIDWNCRCFVVQVSDRDARNEVFNEATKKELNEIVPVYFRFNAWIDRIIFAPSHPYFNVTNEEEGRKNRNFGLPIPLLNL